MAWEKVTYWMAVGMLTVVAGNSFVSRHRERFVDLADQSAQLREILSGRAMSFMNLAEMMVGRGQTRVVRVQTKVACAQARLASMEIVMAREQSGLARLASERARIAMIEQVRPRLICPRRGLAMAIPRPHPITHGDAI
jgi:hypothetical protein